ncbi:GSCOCG00005627001-RA-CDS [Cotesia congregata]|uniref:tRNA(His) guanylyltransferase n=1 Tax=Cotesia congregata TaxID=51543 RepID=A0A8J2HHW5_COTCN|nr:GSCOCG00005627001-RA-CDS [Cotesia congregata]CAG5099691.1 Similar to THG1L: Probable tRNA(His) guanylyltransferase (Homo sapiens) [Cotesia congregata]
MRSIFSKLNLSVPVIINRFIKTSSVMAKSKFEYVRLYERDNVCLQNCWIVVRIDGKNFSKFSDDHKFLKPNDIRALELMNIAASAVIREFHDIVLAFGQSDEYSFVFRKETSAYNRRETKLLTYVNSLFSSAYTFHWRDFFTECALKYPPSFDARVVLYPSDENLRDYLSWRQADVHINNLYNTCFWNLVQRQNMTTAEAQEKLKGTVSSQKNDLLFDSFGINYNNELPIYRKGTTIIKKLIPDENGKMKSTVLILNEDIIGDRFWKEHPEILDPKAKAKINNLNCKKSKS